VFYLLLTTLCDWGLLRSHAYACCHHLRWRSHATHVTKGVRFIATVKTITHAKHVAQPHPITYRLRAGKCVFITTILDIDHMAGSTNFHKNDWLELCAINNRFTNVDMWLLADEYVYDSTDCSEDGVQPTSIIYPEYTYASAKNVLVPDPTEW
jgi:hypothetical protein